MTGTLCTAGWCRGLSDVTPVAAEDAATGHLDEVAAVLADFNDLAVPIPAFGVLILYGDPGADL